MAATIHLLHPQSSSVAGFLRVGHTGHKKLEEMHAAGRFPYRRVVFDAAQIADQVDLLKSLKAGGCEIVLDPNFAEMATVGRFGSSIRKLPWANPERSWEPSDFGVRRNLSVAKAIADFAVKYGVNVVLAPGHLIEHVSDPWQAIDAAMCEALRIELDKAGGSGIAIDYQIITTMTLLKEAANRRTLVAEVPGLPVQNVWLRTSGFGATSTGVATRHYVEAVRDLHYLRELPLVADAAGGFAGLAAAAFGAVGGLSHGVGLKESFKASDWRKPPSKGFGTALRVYVPELDRYFKETQVDAIFQTRGGRSRFGCNDTTCCAHSEDMLENSDSHFLAQRSRQINSLSSVPEARRAEHFLLRQLDPAVRSARVGARLKIADTGVAKVVSDAKSRLVRLRDALADLHEKGEATTHSRAPLFRGGSRGISVVLGS